MSEIEEQARTIFFALLDRAPADWTAALDELCRDRPEVREKVLLLIKAHQSMVGTGDREEATFYQDVAGRPDAAIGPYKLLEQIGEGGFGVVYLAEQTAPVRRRVALKLLKAGMDTRQVVARFEAERQALAIMDHPNIARVFDGGATDSGRPYFVMEYVKGAPITEYCDRHHLDPRQRLELFIVVCQAVQHAHQKGIIHRDLKPSNILVSLHDTNPVVKVIDFGIAKALGQELTDKTLFTGVDQMIGTPLYMSPEQAGMSDLDVDTRSDIYSLGVLLYELLTGTTPFLKERFRKAAYDEIRRIIREEEPPKPSTRLTDSTESLPSIAASRNLEPRKLSGIVRGELDWVVMKALEKDRNRRYETANGFAAYVQRYLCGETVQAVPPSGWYRFRKFARRNRGPLAIAGASLAALLLATIGLAVNNLMVAREKARADLNFQRAREAVNKYFTLISEDPDLKSKGLEPLRQKLLAAARDYYARFAQEGERDPALRAEFAEARMRLGSITESIGVNRDAIAEFELALNQCLELVNDRPDVVEHQRMTARCQGSLGRLYYAEGRYQDSETSFLRALARLQPLADVHPDSSGIQDELATTYDGAGILYDTTSRPKEAESAYRKAAELRQMLVDRDPAAASPQDRLATSHVHLGDLFALTGRQADAETAYRKALGLRRRLTADHPGVAEYQDSLAICLLNAGLLHHDLGSAAKAEPLLSEARDIWRKLSDLHPAVMDYQHGLASSHNNLGSALADLRRFEEADAAQQKAMEIWRKLAGAHPSIVKFAVELGGSQCNMGNRARDARRSDKALEWYVQAVATLEGVLRREERHVVARQFLARAQYGRGLALGELGQHAEAVAAFSESIRIQPEAGEPHCEMARVLQLQGKFKEALPVWKRGHELGSKNPRWPYPSAQWIRDCERLIQFDGQLAAMLRGEAPPAGADDRIGLAEFCVMYKRMPATALRLWTELLSDKAAPSNDATAIQIYNAACAAAQAAAGDGLDAAKLGADERVRWRKQALVWLNSALGWWNQRVAKAEPAARAEIEKRMQRWQEATEFEFLRAESALAKLPETERGGWRRLWTDVAALRARSKEAAAERGKAKVK
ncbi:MAG TPA: protein kinase [Planctomycetia bacterium]|nr:protein kinase [Planctomycetia bacterium]